MTLIAIWAFITANPTLITLGTGALFEIIARRKPTKRDWSIINLIKFVIDTVIKNRNNHGSTHI